MVVAFRAMTFHSVTTSARAALPLSGTPNARTVDAKRIRAAIEVMAFLRVLAFPTAIVGVTH